MHIQMGRPYLTGQLCQIRGQELEAHREFKRGCVCFQFLGYEIEIYLLLFRRI